MLTQVDKKVVRLQKVKSLRWHQQVKFLTKYLCGNLAVTSGVAYSVKLTASAPKSVAKVLREAVLIARKIGPTYIHLYTPCILEIGLSANEGLWEMKEQDKERFVSFKYVSPEAEEYLKECKKEGLL